MPTSFVPQSYHTFEINARPVTWDQDCHGANYSRDNPAFFCFCCSSENYKIVVWKIVKELLRHILALIKLWLRYSTVPLTIFNPRFFPLIAEQPATPYPEGITKAEFEKRK